MCRYQCPKGGGQEFGIRPGTLNVAAIVGLGAASLRAKQQMEMWSQRTHSLRARFESQLFETLPDISINGDVANRLPHVSNIAFHGVDSDGLLTMLPELVASTGSACHYADFNPSHVLTALKKTPDVSECSLRFGFIKDNTEAEVDRAVQLVRESVEQLRLA